MKKSALERKMNPKIRNKGKRGKRGRRGRY